jgi:integrase
MAKIRFTAGRVTSFQCPPDKQQAFLWDSEAPGLGLRATAGAKAYIFQAKLLGKVIRTTIGDPGTWALEEARDSKTGLIVTPGARQEARRLKALTDLGRDPRQIKADATAADAAQRRKTKEEKTPALEAWNDYVTARTGKWSKRHQADHESMAREGGEPITRGRRPNMPATKEPGILRPLLLLPLADITRDRVAVWLEEEGPKRPTRTRLALSLLATFLNWCADRPAYRDQVVADACVRMKRELPKPKAKDDCLQREQLPLWFDAVRELSNPVVKAYLQCLLLVGCRREELAGLQWEDINFQWKSLTIRDKVEGTRTIPLTPYVATLLLELKRLRDAPPKVRALRGPDPQGEKKAPSTWVFSSRSAAAGRLTEPRIAHNRALEAAGLPHLSIHGLRRSFGTLAEWVECPAGIAAQIMGHKPSATAEKHYRRRPLDLLRVWHTKIEGWILQQAGMELNRENYTPQFPHLSAAG